MIARQIVNYLRSRFSSDLLIHSNFVDSGSDHLVQFEAPSVTIVIPTRDSQELLERCLDSLVANTLYPNFEVVIVNNGSQSRRALDYLIELESRGFEVLEYPHKFNFSKICNFAAGQIDTDYICFLNNDTYGFDPNWLSHMMQHARNSSVGLVGSKLLYHDERIQHLGVVLDYKGVAGHAFEGFFPESSEVRKSASSCFQVSAVTFACCLVSKQNFEKFSGLDEAFGIGLSDIEFSIRVNRAGYANVLCGKSQLFHDSFGSRPKSLSLNGLVGAIRDTLVFMGTRNDLEIERYFATEPKKKSLGFLGTHKHQD